MLVVQLLRVNRQGDGVQIDDTEDVVVLRLGLRPVAQRAQVVTQVQVARRLNAGKDALLHGCIRCRCMAAFRPDIVDSCLTAIPGYLPHIT